MNKNTLLLFIFFAFHVSSIAQVCTGNFIFNTQQDVDDFLVNNPTCTSIDGNVLVPIDYFATTDLISNLDGLQNIQSVTGDMIVEVNNGPFSLLGLSNLTSVGGELSISDVGGVPNILSYDGLENLVSVNQLSIIVRTTIDFSPLNNLASANEIFLNFWFDGIGSPIAVQNVFPAIDHLDGGLSMTSSNYYGSIEFSGFHNLISAGEIYLNQDGQPYLSFLSFDAFDNLVSCDNLIFDFCIMEDFTHGFEHLQFAEVIWCDLSTYNGTYPDFSQVQQVVNFYIWATAGDVGPYPPIHLPNLVSCSGEILISGNFPEINLDHLASTGGLSIYSPTPFVPMDMVIFAPELDSVGWLLLRDLNLTDLSCFPDLDYIGGIGISMGGNADVEITGCPLLSNCAIAAMCDKLSTNPGSVIFENNALGCNTTGEVLSDCSISYVTGLVYADLNCDGTLNGNDIPFANSIIHDQNNVPVGSSYSNGEYYAGLPDNSTTTIHAMVPSGFLSGPEYTFTTTNLDEVFSNYDFPLCPNLNFHDVRVYSFSGQPRPGFYLGYQVIVVNDAVPTESVLVSFDMNNMPGASIFSSNGTITGNTVTWTVSDLLFMELNQFYVQIYVDPTTPLGTIYTPIVTATLLSAIADDEPSDNVFSFTQTVIGSYDPNDKTVNRTAIDVAELSPDEGEWLDYTIRFQNTGTAEAINVRVDDIIEEDLDLATFQMLDASHLFQLSFDENRKVEWLFENILLPDSGSNEPASHGFIHFRIKTKNNLQLTDVIENSVAIYFDYNEPIITNTATTSFYVCPAQVSISGVEAICQNEDVTLTASENWNTYSWTLNGNQVSTTNDFYSNSLNVGSNELQLEASTDLCSSNTSFTVDVFPTPTTPVITQNGNTLTATGTGTYTWTLNGEVLSDTDSSIEITETGNYGVSYVDVCPSLPASGQFEFVGVNEWKASERILISPNPTNDATTIILPSAWTGQNEITLFDAIGKAVISEKISATKFTWQLSTSPKGCYQVLVTNTFSGESISSKLVLE